MSRGGVWFPPSYQKDIDRALRILKRSGCSEVYLFGSLAEGKHGKGRDVDLAVRGCPRGRFFALLGKLILALDHPVDLIDLDSKDPFARYLEHKRRMLRVG